MVIEGVGVATVWLRCVFVSDAYYMLLLIYMCCVSVWSVEWYTWRKSKQIR